MSDDGFEVVWGESSGISWDLDSGVTTRYRNGEVVERVPPRYLYSWEGHGCDVFWGSHGCHRKPGHRGWCHCDHEECGFPYGGRRPRKPPEWWHGDDEEWRPWREYRWQFFFGNHEDTCTDAVRMNRKMRRAVTFPLILVLPLRVWLDRRRRRRRFAEPHPESVPWDDLLPLPPDNPIAKGDWPPTGDTE